MAMLYSPANPSRNYTNNKVLKSLISFLLESTKYLGFSRYPIDLYFQKLFKRSILLLLLLVLDRSNFLTDKIIFFLNKIYNSIKSDMQQVRSKE